MENPGGNLLEVEIIGFPKGIRPTHMEEGAATALRLGHHIGIGSGGLGGGFQVGRIDLVFSAIFQDPLAQRIFSD